MDYSATDQKTIAAVCKPVNNCAFQETTKYAKTSQTFLRSQIFRGAIVLGCYLQEL